MNDENDELLVVEETELVSEREVLVENDELSFADNNDVLLSAATTTPTEPNTSTKPPFLLASQTITKSNDSKSASLRDQIKSGVYSMLTVLLYYLFSICLTFYNRHLFVTYRFPLSITLIHLIFKFVTASVIRLVLNCCHHHRRGVSVSSGPRVTLDWYTYLTRIVPTGVASAADIGLSNWSLEYITITLYTMCKSTVILFIFFFSILFRLERWQRSIILVVSCISLGLFLFTYHSTQFHWFGFSLVMLASFSSGLRWTLAQSVTQKHELGLGNPVDMIFHIQPVMILFLLPLAVYIEGLSVISTDKFFRQADTSVILDHVLWLMVGAVLAFFLESSEFLVVLFTSSLTLSISGIFKEVCVIYLAVVWNHNKLNNMNTAGLVLCLLGIAIHVGLKARQKATTATTAATTIEEGRHKSKTTSLSELLASGGDRSGHRARAMSETVGRLGNSRESSSSSVVVTNGKKLAVRKSYGWSTFYKSARGGGGRGDRSHEHGHNVVESEQLLLLESPVTDQQTSNNMTL